MTPPRGAGGSRVTIFQLESMYGSYIPSLSFLGQIEAEIKNCPPCLEGGLRTPPGGAMLGVGIGGDPQSGGHLFSSHSGHLPIFRILVQPEAEIQNTVLQNTVLL